MELKVEEIKILKFLVDNYPDYIDSSVILNNFKNFNRQTLRKVAKFFEEEFLIEVRWFLGGNFITKATSHGVKLLREHETNAGGRIQEEAILPEITLSDLEKENQEKNFSKYLSNSKKN